ncbi:hypothetical protein [uncultured Polaribacter sp.]|uniref:hypothetical protein n=1 Tax=uncultured Polaribacter sp. TaxID=174711 RepID=UPI002606D998|nr:hypothetical protein [uncultured Polaribacter sp.]
MKKFKILFLFLLTVFLQNCDNTDESIDALEDPTTLSPSEVISEGANATPYQFDSDWGANSYWASTIVSTYWTNILKGHHANAASTFGISEPRLYLIGGSGSNNAKSYHAGYVLWGEQFLDLANNYGTTAVAYIAAHEVGHQVQFQNNYPSKRYQTNTIELQADCFAGYYVRRKVTANSTNHSRAANFAYSIGENITNGTHGSKGQRRASTRIGLYLGKWNLTNAQIDYYFDRYYANLIYPGTFNNYYGKDSQLTKVEKEIFDFFSTKTEELSRIYNEEMSDEEYFKDLKLDPIQS